MDEEIYDADGQFTDKYKFQIMIHPVVQELFIIALKGSKKDEYELSRRELHDEFFEALERSSEKFCTLGLKAFDESDIVQNGLSFANDVLYQFAPEIAEFQPQNQNYIRINKLFWGKFFYMTGLKEAERLKDLQKISPWDLAKHYADEYWKFGQSEFPEAIRLGFTFLLENDPRKKLNLSKITDLLSRFGYNIEAKLGFCYFLGLTAMVNATGESADDMQRRIWRLPSVDINIEFQEILGPLHDSLLNQIYDELVWRCKGDFEVRQVMIPNGHSPITEYNFKNNFLILSDTKKTESPMDLEEVFTEAMTKLGKVLIRNSYDPIKAYKAGVCASNVRAQFDVKTTWAAAAYLKQSLPLILSAAHRMTVQEECSWEGYLDPQVPLQQFLSNLPYDLGRMVWSYQSFVFFQDGILKQGVEDLDTMQFMTECKAMAVKFLHHNKEHIRLIAANNLHWQIFPSLQEDQDERSEILDLIKANFGFTEGSKIKAHQMCLRAAIIFAYFCSICETISFEDHPPLFN